MRSNLSIRAVGLSVSAMLAVPYVLVMLASLLWVGLGTTGSVQAALLGIGWNTIAGFEIGLLAILIVGLAVALAFVPAYNAVRRLGTSQSGGPSAQPWAIRLLAVCLVLPALTLVGLRALAPVLSAGIALGPSAGSHPVNLGAAINTAHRDTEPSFTADGRTMYFNCNSGDICVSHLVGTWEAGNWTPL